MHRKKLLRTTTATQTKRRILFLLLKFVILTTNAQNIIVTTLDNSKVEINIVSDSSKHRLLQDFNGKQDNTLHKQWTSRIFLLSDKRLLIEFYDRQAAVVKNKKDFDKLEEIRFVKNYIDFLKKNVTYKIEISFEKGLELSKTAKLLPDLKSETPEYHDFEVYEMKTGQILFLNKSANLRNATVYENIKGLCSDNDDILNQYYKGMDEWAEQLINGDPLFDYEINDHLVYPKDIPTLIKNHDLSIVESKVYVNNYFGNLYKSAKDYYILIDEINQKNGAGKKMKILAVRVYENLEAVRKAQAKYDKFKNEGVKSEHFYQNISDQYGQDFPAYTKKLIDTLPLILNFDKKQLTFDSIGMAIVDEAIRWNHSNKDLFDQWYPSVLAYYGQCYITDKKDGKWVVRKEKDFNVWIPNLVLKNNENTFDVYDFYKDLFEWPQPLKVAGDWDGWRKNMRKKMDLDTNYLIENSFNKWAILISIGIILILFSFLIYYYGFKKNKSLEKSQTN